MPKASNTAKKSKPVNKKTTAKPSVKKPAPKSKASDGYKPTDKEPYMNKKQLAYFREKLLGWKRELLNESTETLGHLKEENWNEPDITDRATVETDTALELRTRDRYRKLISKIDQAILRIDEGEYGYCEVTGEPIGIKRLEARPIATMTLHAQEEHERDEKLHANQ